MERYPSYRLEDFFRKSYSEGGLTIQQMTVLYEDSQKRMLEKYKFYATLQGAEFADESSTEKVSEGSKILKPVHQSGTMFQSPSAYKHLSQKQKEELTRSMMGSHRQALSKAPGMRRG
jgi:hypothetical protein